MRTQLSHLVNRLVVSAGSPYATAVLAIVLLLFDLLLWLTHLNTTLLLLGSLALSELTVLLLPPILHSTLVGDKATHVKLDALIKALEGVEDRVMGAERLSEAELEALKRDVHEMESNHSA